ncbi:hypothetical protein QBC33DRAFT_564417 [Phialemonium atrogriseum]|uniref:Uncharacterized protein n=1 Tax=Phialemonium atrogriseum TaxID=1093897 RepID=A0AAJ0BR13_9PEZI|nr:uncharacterized protein QBC33DRAFT_564417 [Phialemonium atrogriseum]KAK1761823.1 hypothetical protein QBC33DRAFT_564417 [Phialemonium atrogriseum]
MYLYMLPTECLKEEEGCLAEVDFRKYGGSSAGGGGGDFGGGGFGDLLAMAAAAAAALVAGCLLALDTAAVTEEVVMEA